LALEAGGDIRLCRAGRPVGRLDLDAQGGVALVLRLAAGR